jgi:hypothetical protein
LRPPFPPSAPTPGTGWDLRPKGTGVELVLRF